MLVSFQKNVFYSNEAAHATITVDNKNCPHDITETEFQVVQKVHLDGGRFSQNFDILENKDKSTLKAHAGETTKIMQLDLNQISYPVEPNKKNRG